MFLAVTALHSAAELGDMNWDLASFPVFSKDPIGPQAYPFYFYVTTMSDHKDQAFEVISYLTSEEYQTARAKEGTLLPTLNDRKIRQQFGQNNTLYKGKNVKALQPDKYAPAGSVNPYTKSAGDDLGTGIKDMLLQGKDMNTMLRETADKVNKKIEQAETAKK
jgi:ABC-type glycerol-3-phosphate transport system substrate-binding protein